MRCLTFEAVVHRPPRRRLAPANGIGGGKQLLWRMCGGFGRGITRIGFSQSQRHRHPAEARRSGAGVRHPHHPGGADPPLALDRARPVPGDLDHPVDPDPDDGAVHPGAAGILLVPDRAVDRDHAAAVAQPRLDAADPFARSRGNGRRRPRHRGVRQFRDGRQFRDRDYRLRDPGDRQFRRHHQGLGTHRRSGGALPPRRHAGQADGDRRRPLRRPDRREDRKGPPQGAGGRKRLLRRHGRRLEIRARRRGRGTAGGVHQHHRRHHHRRRAAEP